MKNPRPTRKAKASRKKPMLQPITLRLPAPMVAEIEALVAARVLEGVDRASVIRELIARGLKATKTG